MPICPECRDGKHNNCAGFAFHPVSDEQVDCACPTCHTIKKENT